MKAFLLNSGQGWPLSWLLFNILLEALATAIRLEKEIKSIWLGKEKVKLSLVAEDMILCIENPKVSTQNLLELRNEFSKITGYKINIQKSFVFYINNKMSKRGSKKFCLKLHQKKKYLRINLNQEGERAILLKL